MNCPYCSESIHSSAKFCPKCGLPLKDDATVMGSMLVDESGPSPWIWAAGGLAIVSIAAALGWMGVTGSGKNLAPRPAVVRQPVPTYMASAAGASRPAAGSAWGLPPANPWGGGSVLNVAPAPSNTGPAFSYNAQTNYVYTPPAPKPRRVIPEAPPPRVPLFNIMHGRRKAPPSVTVARPDAPPMPPRMVQYSLPPWYATGFGAQSRANNSMGRVTFDGNSGGDLRDTSGGLDNSWAWDPIQQQFVRAPLGSQGGAAAPRPSAPPSAPNPQNNPVTIGVVPGFQ